MHASTIHAERASVVTHADARFARQLLLLGVIILGTAIRIARLQFQPLWWDEGYSVWFATHPIGQMLVLTAEDIHPPLYYAILHGWTLLIGTGPVALRLLSVAVGVLAIPALYVAGRRLFDPTTALIAACLLAASPMHVYYSQEVRMYGLVAFFATLLLAVAWRALRSDRPVFTDLAWYVLLATAALYTQYYAIFLPIGLTLFAMWRWRHQPSAIGRWLLAQTAVALLYLPWVLYATPKLIPYVSQKVVADADRPLALVPYAARHLAAFVAGHLQGQLAPYWPAALLLLVPLGAGLFYRLHAARLSGDRDVAQAAGMLAITLLAALALGYSISRSYPFFPPEGERLLLLALPCLILLSAAALTGLWQQARVAGLLVALLAGLLAAASLWSFYTVPRFSGDDYRPLLARIVEQGRPEDTVFAVYPWQVGYWRSYGDPNGPQAVLSPQPAWGSAVRGALDQALSRGHLWFPAHLSLGALLETRIENYLGERSQPFLNQWYGPGTRLSGWSADASVAEAPLAIKPLRFVLPQIGELRLTLEGVSADSAPVPAANVATTLTLDWQAAARPPLLATSIRLVDDLGHIWAQHDYEPLGGATISDDEARSNWSGQDRVALLVPAGTPPGKYHVELAVRPAGEEQALDVLASDGRRANSARLFDLEVAPAGRSLGTERLPIGQREQTDLKGGLRYLGLSMDNQPLAPGELRKINLFWQAATTPPDDYKAFVQLLGEAGKPPVAGWEAPPGASYATSQWAPGTLMRTQGDLRLPADLPDGNYRLIGGLFRQRDGQRLETAAGADHLDLGTVSVRGRQHVFTPAAPTHAADVRFSSFARLAGYDLAATDGRPGGQVPLTLYWQATGTAPQPYAVFVHLVDASAGTQYGAGDGEPGGGSFPTTGWVSGEYMADEHTLSIDPGTPPGTYRVVIGLYDPTSGQRIVLPDGADHFELDTPIEIR